jgi:hypothetical protein
MAQDRVETNQDYHHWLQATIQIIYHNDINMAFNIDAFFPFFK